MAPRLRAVLVESAPTTVGEYATSSVARRDLKPRSRACGPGTGDAQRLSTRFAHGDGRTAGVRHYGIGLAVVREIVEAHDGEIPVEGTPGHGATFALRPRARTEAGTANKRCRQDGAHAVMSPKMVPESPPTLVS